jgi:hypothetical protein
MPRFRRALACAAMAIAAAGGGLAAGAIPAYASTPAHPAGGHTTTTSFTAVPGARATGGIGPKFQCGETCDPGGDPAPPPPPPTITCTISVEDPYDSGTGALVFGSHTSCTGSVARITMTQNVVHTPGGTLTNSADVPNNSFARAFRVVPCVPSPDSWSVSASATITPPAGWVIIAGHNPIVASTPMPVSFMNCSSPDGGGGGGGGGGCAIGTPSAPAQPSARQPEVVTC